MRRKGGKERVKKKRKSIHSPPNTSRQALEEDDIVDDESGDITTTTNDIHTPSFTKGSNYNQPITTQQPALRSTQNPFYKLLSSPSKPILSATKPLSSPIQAFRHVKGFTSPPIQQVCGYPFLLSSACLDPCTACS
jgi:hypothetical protein